LLLVLAVQLAVPLSLSAQSTSLLNPRPPSIFEIVGAAYNFDPSLLQAIASVESGGKVNTVSPKGALGLMQLMPYTAHRFGVSDPLDPVESLLGAARFLAYLRQYGEVENLPELLAAYNAGEGAVERYHGIPPFAETREYVRRVLISYLLGDEPPLKKAVQSGRFTALTPSARGGQPSLSSLAPHQTPIRRAQQRTALNQVRSRGPEPVHLATDADVLARLEQIRRARSDAARHEREAR
jgi:hypothetical protein